MFRRHWESCKNNTVTIAILCKKFGFIFGMEGKHMARAQYKNNLLIRKFHNSPCTVGFDTSRLGVLGFTVLSSPRRKCFR